MNPDDWATPDDIHAARPDVPLKTIHRHMRDGKITGAVKIGRTWFVPAEEAARYVETYERYAR